VGGRVVVRLGSRIHFFELICEKKKQKEKKTAKKLFFFFPLCAYHFGGGN
jgi:hypothetical protein